MSELSQEIPLYVVNLAGSAERRESMRRQADALGLQLRFFEAVNGRQPHPLFAHVNADKRLARKGRPFRPGEIGCWASHYLLWQQCVDSKRPMIVLEDDIVIEADFSRLLQALPGLPAEIGYFRLHASDDASREWLRFGDQALHRYWQSPMRTLGYYLAPSAAERFLSHAQEWTLPVDDYMDLAWLHGVECLGVKPGVVRDAVFASTIRGEAMPKSEVGLKRTAMREGYRLWLDLRRFLHDLPARLRGPVAVPDLKPGATT